MSNNPSFEKNKILFYLSILGKEYRKLSKNKIQIILVGGASIIVRYSFRINSYDLDGLFAPLSDALKQAIHTVADQYNLPSNWLNDDFKYTNSYSINIIYYSEYFKTFSNVLEVRIINPTHLIAMKLVSFRKYKNDLSDVVGVLLEEENRGHSITKEDVITALKELYGENYHQIVNDEALKTIDYLFISKIRWKELIDDYKDKDESSLVASLNILRN